MHIILVLLVSALLAACNPTYNWRDFTHPQAAYRASFPDKPASFTRDVDLNGTRVTMTMTAARVNEVVFAIAYADVSDLAQAQAALSAMQVAMVRNIQGSITSSKAVGTGADITAKGAVNGQPMQLQGRFRAHGKRLYQVVVMGPAAAIEQEQAETFLSGFILPDRAP